MKIFRLNLAMYNVIYRAGYEANYHVIKDVLDSLETEDVYWLVTSPLSILTIFRTKDFYKIFARFIIETIQKLTNDIPKNNSEEAMIIRKTMQEEIIKLTSAIFNTTKSDKVKAEFSKHLFTSRAICVYEMMPHITHLIKPFLTSNHHEILLMDDTVQGVLTPMLNMISSLKSDLEVYQSVINTIE